MYLHLVYIVSDKLYLISKYLKKEGCQVLEKNIVLMEETSGGVIEAGTSEDTEAAKANSVRIWNFYFIFI